MHPIGSRQKASAKLVFFAFLVGFVIHIAGDVIDAAFFFGWRPRIRDYAISVGMPIGFVANVVTFVLLHLPNWFTLGVLTTSIGGSKWGWGRAFAVYVSCFYPVVHLIDYLMVTKVMALQVDLGRELIVNVFGLSLFAIPIGLAGWWLGNGVRKAFERVKQQHIAQA